MRSLFRTIRIIYSFSKYRLDKFIPTELLPLHIRLLIMVGPWRLFPTPSKLTRGERLREALIDLGPIFIKLGQILSTRRDLLPPDVADALAALQDKVPPFDSHAAKQIIEEQLGQTVDQIFSQFDRDPMASASIAQVHGAKLMDGTDVIVKVIRPNILPVILRDTRLMKRIASWVERISEEGRRLRPVEVVTDYRRTILAELDLLNEAANCSQLRRNFLDSEILYVPEVYWDLCRTKVMVQERIYGVPVSDIEKLKAAGTDMKLLADRGVEIFFTQVFRDSFFHADMHPGNIFVDITDPTSPKYIGIDCGIMGSLGQEDQSYLARNLLAFFNQDYHQVAQLHIDSGWVDSGTQVNEFEASIRSVSEPIFEKPLEEISFGTLLIRLFQTARKFNMQVQPQLVLLQKTLLNIEGLGRQLYPQLDLWSTAKPYLEAWFKEQYGPKRMWKELQRQVPLWLERAPHMPQLAHDALLQLEQLDKLSEKQTKALNDITTSLNAQRRQSKRQVIAGWLLLAIGAGTLADLDWAAIWQALQSQPYALGLLVIGGILILKK